MTRSPAWVRPQANVLVYDLASYELGSQLVVSSQPPSSVPAGDPFGLTVTVEDRFGNVETSFNGSVTVAFGSNPGGGPLRGTLIATATNGVAVFSGLSINTAGTGYTLQATGVGLTAATTTFINVTPGPAAELAVTTQPPGYVAIDSSFGLTVAAEDIYGNVATDLQRQRDRWCWTTTPAAVRWAARRQSRPSKVLPPSPV